MAKFLPANKLCSLRSLSSDLGRTETWKHSSHVTSVGSLAAVSSDGVIPQVASHQVSKVAERKEQAQEKNKVSWMRDPPTGYWIPKDHFAEIDSAELREKVLSSRK